METKWFMDTNMGKVASHKAVIFIYDNELTSSKISFKMTKCIYITTKSHYLKTMSEDNTPCQNIQSFFIIVMHLR